MDKFQIRKGVLDNNFYWVPLGMSRVFESLAKTKKYV